MSQSQPLRFECEKYASFGTSRTINSALWFVNNKPLQERILGYFAKYQQRYEVTVYAFAIEGSHTHPLCRFKDGTRASFYRDLNARTAEAVRYECPNYPGGPLFERRYSEQAVPTNKDIFDQFFYTVLQPVNDGLCERISDYPGYNCFDDASLGIEREFEVVNWEGFNRAKRRGRDPRRSDYTTKYKLKYARLPGFEDLSQSEYRALLVAELERRQTEIVDRYKAESHKFSTRLQLERVVPGTLAKNPKKSKRGERRPLVLSKCKEARRNFLDHYFQVFAEYKQSVAKFLAGDLTVPFPGGTYRPPGPFVPLRI